MRTRLMTAALAVCIPTAVFAQRGGGASDPAPTGFSAQASPSAKAPSSRDLANLNPASLLVSKRKKASLADSTVAQLKAVEKAVDARNAPFFATYDSVHKWTMPLAGSNSSSQSGTLRGGAGDAKLTAPTSSPAEMAKMQSSMRDLRTLMSEFRERHKADAADALNVIPEAQKKAATDLLSQQDGDLEKLIGGRP
jgi:hypothetical protein